MPELLIFTLRPDGTSLWLPQALAESMGLKKGDRMTEAQYNGEAVQELIRARLK